MRNLKLLKEVSYYDKVFSFLETGEDEVSFFTFVTCILSYFDSVNFRWASLIFTLELNNGPHIDDTPSNKVFGDSLFSPYSTQKR